MDSEKELTIEESLLALQGIIASMESGSQSLEEALTQFEEGMALIKHCTKQIDQVEKRMIVLGNEETEDEV